MQQNFDLKAWKERRRGVFERGMRREQHNAKNVMRMNRQQSGQTIVNSYRVGTHKQTNTLTHACPH